MLHQTYPQTKHGYQYEINKDMHLSTAHYVPHPSAGVCQQVHGHTYFVNISVAGDDLDDSGFLVDFKALKDLVHGIWDHTLLNDDKDRFSTSDPNRFPTSEVVARTIWERVQAHLDMKHNRPTCVQVFVRETPTSYAIFRPKKGTDLA